MSEEMNLYKRCKNIFKNHGVDMGGGGVTDPILENAKETGGIGYTKVEYVVACDQDILFTPDDPMMAALLPEFDIIEGVVYTVEIDSEAYQSECVTLAEEGAPIIGNLSLIGTYDDTGEPYIIARDGNKVIMFFNGTQSSVHVYISYTGPVTRTINTEYIPTKDRGCKIPLYKTEDMEEIANADIYTVGDSRLYVSGTFNVDDAEYDRVTYYCRMSDMPDFVTDIVYDKFRYFARRPQDVGFRSNDYPIYLGGFLNEIDETNVLELEFDFHDHDCSHDGGYVTVLVTELLPSLTPS